MELIKKSFWEGKKVFITGHTGFKGGWLSLWLQKLGADVYGYALEADGQENLYDIAEVGDGMHSTFGNILDHSYLEKVLISFDPDIVFHLAAQPLVLEGYNSPRETYLTNIIGTVNLLECLRKVRSVKSVVNVTTDKCYQNIGSKIEFSEDHPLGGNDPYSSSKASAEIVSHAYRKSYFCDQGISLATARAGNVIGGGDWGKFRIIPDILRALKTGERLKVRNPYSIRPWQHVLEPLQGYLLLGQVLYNNEDWADSGWNFGPRDDEAVTVRELIELISDLWGESLIWDVEKNNTNNEDRELRLSSRKAESLLSWNNVWSLREAMTHTVHWFREYREGKDMKAVTHDQISEYTKRLDIINNT